MQESVMPEIVHTARYTIYIVQLKLPLENITFQKLLTQSAFPRSLSRSRFARININMRVCSCTP